MKKSTMGALLHFDMNASPLTVQRISAYAEAILACFAGLDAPLCGHAEVLSADAEAVQRFDMSSPAAWPGIAAQLTPAACRISISLSNDGYGAVTLQANIARHPSLSPCMIGCEQTLRLSVEQKLWRMAGGSLKDCFMKLCGMGDISYAAIDRDALTPHSIYHANLRLLADKYTASAIDAEHRIPGVYWLQYWGGDMLTAEVWQSLRALGTFVRAVGGGAWVQTAVSIRADSAEAHRILYDLIQLQTYTPDEKVLTDYRRLQPWLFDRFPIAPPSDLTEIR